MSIKLNWDFSKEGEDGTRIYRSLTPFTKDELPEVYVEIGSGVREYVDEQTEPHTVYCYRFGRVEGESETVSELHSAYSNSYTGPGPQTLIAGNFHDVGLFGEVEKTDFWTPHELCLDCGIEQFSHGLSGDGNNDFSKWLKVFHNGKVKYIALSPMADAVSWKDLYENGLVFGQEGDCLDQVSEELASELTPTGQRKVIQYDLNYFIPRLLEGANGAETLAGSNLLEWKDSEFNKTLYPITGYRNLDGSGTLLPVTITFKGAISLLCSDSHGLNVHGRQATGNYSTGLQVRYDLAQVQWFPVLEWLPVV